MKVNGAKCRLCGDIVISRHRHDYAACKCGAIAVDGGNDYQRCIGEPGNFIPLEDYQINRPKGKE